MFTILNLLFGGSTVFIALPPSAQLWDLRFAASPVKVFEKHEKGILSIAWCPQDSDLLLSAGKDNHVYCFNPNSAEYGGEVSSSGLH